MRAIVLNEYGQPDDLQLREIPKPEPKDNEILVNIHAASVNDWDWGLVRGDPFYIRIFCGLRKPKFPIPGVDIAGEVEAVGQNVRKFQVGDAVYGDLSESGFGGFAEYVCASESVLELKPTNMTFAEAAATPHAICLAVQGLRDVGQLQSGQKLLINGAGGGVGTLGVQLAKYMGAGDVTGVDSAGKLEMMRTIGFDHVIDYQQEDFTQNGQTYDLILDTKTNRSVFDYARALAPDGRYVTVGGTTPTLLQTFLLGSIIGRFGSKMFKVVGLQPNKDLAYFKEVAESGNIKPVMDGPFQLDEVPAAIQYFGEAKHTGKVIITMASSGN